MDTEVVSIFHESGKNGVADWKPALVTKPKGRIFSTNQVAAATFLGAPLAGAALFARNYQVLGKTGTACLSLALGAIATVLLVAIALVLPKGIPTFLPLISIVGMRALVNRYQGRAISNHEYAGGAKGSWVVSIAVGAQVCFAS